MRGRGGKHHPFWKDLPIVQEGAPGKRGPLKIVGATIDRLRGAAVPIWGRRGISPIWREFAQNITPSIIYILG